MGGGRQVGTWVDGGRQAKGGFKLVDRQMDGWRQADRLMGG